MRDYWIGEFLWLYFWHYKNKLYCISHLIDYCKYIWGEFTMSLRITFVDPNTSEDVDKYLPKILAEAVLNKIAKEFNDAADDNGNVYDVRHSA